MSTSGITQKSREPIIAKVAPDLIEHLKPGCALAIVGPTVSGKSFLLKNLVDRYLLKVKEARLFGVYPFEREDRAKARYTALGCSTAVNAPLDQVGNTRVSLSIHAFPVDQSSIGGFLTRVCQVANANDLVVIDEWHPQSATQHALDGLIHELREKGVKVVLVASELGNRPDDHLQVIWTATRNPRIEVPMEIYHGLYGDFLDGTQWYRFVPSGIAYWWHTSREDDLAVLQAQGCSHPEAVIRVAEARSPRAGKVLPAAPDDEPKTAGYRRS